VIETCPAVQAPTVGSTPWGEHSCVASLSSNASFFSVKLETSAQQLPRGFELNTEVLMRNNSHIRHFFPLCKALHLFAFWKKSKSTSCYQCWAGHEIKLSNWDGMSGTGLVLTLGFQRTPSWPP
jgi:hypothetical protein